MQELVRVGDSVDVVANALTVVAILLGVVVTRRWWVAETLVLSRQRARRRWQDPPRRRFRRPYLGSSEVVWREERRRVRRITAKAGSSAAEEVDWLCRSLGPRNDARPIDMLLEVETLRGVVRAYREHAAALTGRVLLGTSLPAVAEAQRLADRTAAYLSLLIEGLAARTGSSEALRLSVPSRGLSLRFSAYPGRFRGHMAFDVVTTYRHHIVHAPYAGSLWPDRAPEFDAVALEVQPDEAEALAVGLNEDHLFDGLLPRLRDDKVAIDGASGRARLTLSLTACTYGAVLVDHYPGVDQVARSELAAGPAAALRARGVSRGEIDGSRVQLMTLSLMPVTADGYLVFAQRSTSAGSHEGTYGVGVNGNLELVTRHGVEVDVDAFGSPDPVRAMTREAREELGLDIDEEDVSIVGLARFSVPTEVSTNLLIGMVSLSETLEEVAYSCRHADLVEGRWEVGVNLLGMRLPSRRADSFDEEVAERLAWLVGWDRLSPHATASGVLATAVALRAPEILLTLEDHLPSGREECEAVSRLRDEVDWLVTIPVDW